jgi:hypothetical protein
MSGSSRSHKSQMRNQYYNEADKRRQKVSDTEQAQKINRVFRITKEQKDAVKAIDANQNLREEEAEYFEESARKVE